MTLTASCSEDRILKVRGVEVTGYVGLGLPCNVFDFTVNKIDADEEDFGEGFDHDRDNAKPYCCKDRRFDPYPDPPDGVLRTYNITKDQWKEVALALEKLLKIGYCGLCE